MNSIIFRNGKRLYFECKNGNIYDIHHLGIRLEDDFYEIWDEEYEISGDTLVQLTYKERTFEEKIKPMLRGIAPYNFVPINNTVKKYEIKSEVEKKEADCRYGYIDLSIETLTPTFVRGNDEYPYIENGKWALPGSSIKGMVTTLVEILSEGRFVNFDSNRFLFHRRQYNASSDILPAFLKYNKNKYSLRIPEENPTQTQIRGQEFQYEDYNNDSNEISFTTGGFGRRNGNLHNVRKWTFNTNNLGDEINIKNISLKPNYDSDDDRSSKAPDVFIKARYYAEMAMKSGSDQKYSFGFPVFVEYHGSDCVYISHCKLGRKKYDYKIGCHLPSVHLEQEPDIDYPLSMFGSTEKSGKIDFEPSFGTEENLKKCLMYDRGVYTKMLSSPKPTSDKLYLEPKDIVNPSKWSEKDSIIRGHKMYWHRITPNDETEQHSWREEETVVNDPKFNSEQYPPPINPIKIETKFKGRIRFQGLDTEQLGVLLWALKLEDSCAHKIGLGKPLGLGSIKINIDKLTIIDIKTRYSSFLKSDNEMELGECDCTQKIDDFIKAFKKEMGYDSRLPDRLKELFTLLHFDSERQSQNDWLEKTRYMEIERQENKKTINEFKKSVVLPKATEIV